MGRDRAPTLEPRKRVRIKGDVLAHEDVSAIGLIDGHLVLAADEAVELAEAECEDPLHNVVQVFRPRKTRKKRPRFRLHATIPIAGVCGTELDIEALSVDPRARALYVLGSHSAKRPRVKPKHSLAENRARLAASAIRPEPNRAGLYRLRLNAALDGVAGPPEEIDIAGALARDEVLHPFARLPSKENGIDIEGLARDADGRLILGFRGPVLRENWVPVMVIDPADPATHELRFVALGGRGIRSIERICDGYLVLGGPVGDQVGDYRLYLWDGRCMLPGTRPASAPPEGTLRELAVIPAPKGGKAEGCSVIRETEKGRDVLTRLLIAFDGVTEVRNVVRSFTLRRPRLAQE